MVLLNFPWSTIPVSILYKSTAGRYRPVRVADGPITARCRFIKSADWDASVHQAKILLSLRIHSLIRISVTGRLDKDAKLFISSLSMLLYYPFFNVALYTYDVLR